MTVGVIIAAHNPDPDRLARVLDALAAQTLPAEDWTVTLVDNASEPPISIEAAGLRLAIEREPRLGLAWARLCGIEHSAGDVLVFVDDDNLLDPDYLAEARRIAGVHPEVGVFGGRVVPEWQSGEAPPAWVLQFSDNLALRDLGDQSFVSAPGPGYPAAAPVGAGMVFRREALRSWVDEARTGRVATDRRGDDLTSGGDNEMVILAQKAGFSAGYFPDLRLRHVMPASRLQGEYLARLRYGIERSWVRLLHAHGLSPWSAAHPWLGPLRKARAYIRCSAWSGPAAHVRWRGACGHFDGRADIWRARHSAGPS